MRKTKGFLFTKNMLETEFNLSHQVIAKTFNFRNYFFILLLYVNLVCRFGTWVFIKMKHGNQIFYSSQLLTMILLLEDKIKGLVWSDQQQHPVNLGLSTDDQLILFYLTETSRQKMNEVDGNERSRWKMNEVDGK